MLWGNNKKEEPTFEVARNNDTITVTINGEMATKIKKFDRVVKQMQGMANDPELSKLKWYSNSACVSQITQNANLITAVVENLNKSTAELGELLEMAVQTIQKKQGRDYL